MLGEPKQKRVNALADPMIAVETAEQALPKTSRWLRRFFVALIGGTVLVIGIAMIVLPGPAMLVIPAGLAILATEFLWARRALRQCKGMVVKVKRKPWFRRFRKRLKTKSVTS
jgi:uncharacterized protein (TIGR02611 family)